MKQVKVCLILIAGLASALLLGVGLPSLTHAAPLIPPLPTPVPTAVPTAALPVSGGFIELHAQFPFAWPWTEVHWQELWTMVQWQEKGDWHDVTGWQGTLDQIQPGANGFTGIKGWWVAEDDLGTGPFRWVVYHGPGGAPIGTSEPFDLPECTGQSVIVELSLEVK